MTGWPTLSVVLNAQIEDGAEETSGLPWAPGDEEGTGRVEDDLGFGTGGRAEVERTTVHRPTRPESLSPSGIKTSPHNKNGPRAGWGVERESRR